MTHPSRKASRISSCVILLGRGYSPGFCSLKQSMKYLPPGARTAARLSARAGRSSSERVWKSPESMTVSNVLLRAESSSAFPTKNCAWKSSFCSLLPGLSDRQGGGVDPEHLVPLACKKEDVIPRSASDVQDGTRDLSCPGQFDERLLGAADVPGWRAPVDRVEDIHTVLWVEGRLNRFRGIQRFRRKTGRLSCCIMVPSV